MRTTVKILLLSSAGDAEVTAIDGTIDEGTETGGTFEETKKCDDVTWDIQETANGLDVGFTFRVQGNAKKFKINGKSSTNQDYIVYAWNGVQWDIIETLSFSTTDATYTADLGSEYTIDGETRVRVFRATGNNETIYLDCVTVTADGPATPSGSAVLLEQGGYALIETGDFLLLE